MGTNGTDATVVIDFDDNKVALTADTPINEKTGNDLGEALSLTAHLYDSTHKEVDFYNESLNLSCEWSWFYYNVGYGELVNIKEKVQTEFANPTEITRDDVQQFFDNIENDNVFRK